MTATKGILCFVFVSRAIDKIRNIIIFYCTTMLALASMSIGFFLSPFLERGMSRSCGLHEINSRDVAES